MKKLLLTILLLCLFFALAGFVQAEKTTIVDYPDLPGATKPGEADPGEELPRLIQYLFIFSLSIVGVIGLAAITIGAFGYLTAVGNPQKAADAKDKIFSALLGIILLLGSFLLLRTINPDLLKLGVDAPKVTVPITSNGNGNGGELTGCRLLRASWNKGMIDVGQSAILTLVLSKECDKHSPSPYDYNDRKNFFKEVPSLKQKNPGVGGELDCYEYYVEGSATTDKIENNEIKIHWVYQFYGQCDFWGIGTNCPFWGGGICNLIKDAPEQFYMKGKVKIRNVSTAQYIPKGLVIEVRDNELVSGEYLCVLENVPEKYCPADTKYYGTGCASTKKECEKSCKEAVKSIATKSWKCEKYPSPGTCRDAMGCH